MISYIVHDNTSVPTFWRAMKSLSSGWEFGSDGSWNGCKGKLCRKVARVLASQRYWHITSSQALRTQLNRINSLRKWVQYRPPQRTNKLLRARKTIIKATTAVNTWKLNQTWQRCPGDSLLKTFFGEVYLEQTINHCRCRREAHVNL